MPFPLTVPVVGPPGSKAIVMAQPTKAAGIVIHHSPSLEGKGDPWSVTHEVTGYAFYQNVPTRKHALELARSLGRMANWNKNTVEEVMDVFRSLSAEQQRAIVTIRKLCNERYYNAISKDRK